MSEAKPRDKIGWKSWLAFLTILGVIAVVADPFYSDFVHYRAQVSEAIILMESAKEPLLEHFRKHRKWPDALEKVHEFTNGKYTQSVAITKGAGGTGELELTATMKTEGVDRRVAGLSVRMVSPDGGRNWTCRPGTMPVGDLPWSCQN